MSNRVFRTADIELRSQGEGNKVAGYASVFNQIADIGWFTEEIDRNAFDYADMTDVVLLFNHDTNNLLAGTRNGTLQLDIRDMGLYQESDIIDTTQGKDVLKLVQSGLINKMSFSFEVDRENEGEFWTERNGKEHRIIKRIKRLYDVSLVTFPAYPQTSAMMRSYTDELAEEHRTLLNKRKEQDARMAELFRRTNG